MSSSEDSNGEGVDGVVMEPLYNEHTDKEDNRVEELGDADSYSDNDGDKDGGLVDQDEYKEKAEEEEEEEGGKWVGGGRDFDVGIGLPAARKMRLIAIGP